MVGSTSAMASEDKITICESIEWIVAGVEALFDRAAALS